MKKINTLFKVTMLSTMAIGAIEFAIQSNKSNSTVKAEAAQYLQDYAPYTYSGDYYDKINFSAGDGMNGALKSAIAKKAKPEAYYTYSGTGATTIAEQLQKADEDPNNSSNMIYLYTRNSVKKNAASSWNREHVWPQSCSNNNWGKTVGGVDILHLRPTYNDTNNERGNKKYGDLSDSYAVYYSSMLYGYSSSSYFEPIDQVKGDVAREIMYLWTVYDNSSKTLSITNVFQSYNLMLQWHTMDKPDILEGNRNDYCEKQSKQKNRNPFVDHPELAWKIFGDQVSASVKSACQQAYPGNGSTPVGPVTPTSIVLDKEELTLNKNATYTLHASLMPNGATGTISWSSDDDSVASVNSNGVVTANGVGVAVITASHNSLKAECLVEVVDGSSTQTGELEITDSISVGDTVYLTADDAKKQYNGPSSTSTIYGLGASYTTTPDTDGIGLIVHNGSSSGSYAFELNSGAYESKYLSWSSGNSLTTANTINDNSSWTLSFDSEKNVTISNVATSARKLIWNVSATRFACYTGQTIGASYYITQLWKAGSAPITDTYDFDESFAEFESVASIHGTEHYATTGGTCDVVFKDLGYENAEDFDSKVIDDISITASTNSGTVHPKYYTGGDALRLYGGNLFTVTSSSSNITKITFTFVSGYRSLNCVIGDLSNDVWTGDAQSVSFNITSGTRIVEMVIKYGTSVYDRVDDVSLRFGGEIPKNAWDAVASHEEISDYGVMLVRKNTLVNTYKCSSIEEAFGLDKTLAVVSNGSGLHPFLSGNKYIFKANVKVSNYETEFCAAPFIVINDEYKFLTERTWSAKELAKEMLKVNISELCDDALRDIAGITE